MLWLGTFLSYRLQMKRKDCSPGCRNVIIKSNNIKTITTHSYYRQYRLLCWHSGYNCLELFHCIAATCPGCPYLHWDKKKKTICQPQKCFEMKDTKLPKNKWCQWSMNIQTELLGCYRTVQSLRGPTNLPELSSLTVFSSVGSTSTVFAIWLWCSGVSLDLAPHSTGSY